VQTFAEDYLLRTGRRCFLVQDDGRVVGLVTPQEIRTLDRAQWPHTPLEKVMQPLHQVRAVKPNTPVTEALETMRREDVNQLPVMTDGHLAGIIARSHILQLLEARAELQQV
jgi:CBS domain-containing protein